MGSNGGLTVKNRRTGAYCIGTYPKWMARAMRWLIKRNASTTVDLDFKGRGKPIKGVIRKAYRYGLPVSKATKVAIYVRGKRISDHNGGQ